ncbi:MAG: enoyl-CoA hydratase/isomerase family protein [Bosea sp. (in: a-proteobacteria)]
MNELEPEIICEKRGHAGVVTLNRPRALNALTLGMVRGLASALDAWEHDDTIRHVVVVGAGEKAFCAGGDIRLLHDLGKAGQIEEARAFWREEYVLNVRIKTYRKPYIAIIDGIVMGGGVGVSLHGSHRVAGDKYLFAMPEVSIGFFPDVGATHALPRLPGATGTWLAVSGDRVGQSDALALGLATHAVTSASIGDVIAALVAGDDVDDVLARLRAPKTDAPVVAHRALIDQCFGAPTLEAIVARLSAADDNPFAARILASLATKSPTSMKLALAQMQAGKALNFAEAMRLEFRIVSRVALGHDFYEGVRAVIIDKDHKPDWQPRRLEDVSDAMIAAYLAPLPDELAV